MTAFLPSIFPKPEDLFAMTPEDLGGVIIEAAPSIIQPNGMFLIDNLVGQFFDGVTPIYPRGVQDQVKIVFAEALSWLVTQGLLVVDPDQLASWYRVTRRGRSLTTRADVEAFRKGRLLPDGLLPVVFGQKVVPIFRRGDFDVAVVQAFKEVEVAVRKAALSKDPNFPTDLVGAKLMRKAFHADDGVLTDKAAASSEREALGHLFAGAFGYGRNPTSHQDVNVDALEGARLTIFASYLFGIVDQRTRMP